MNNKFKRNRIEIMGYGKDCPKCSKKMEIRKHRIVPTGFHFTEWEYCPRCNHVQLNDEFKNANWKEHDRVNNHVKSI